jgi:hypothetical protein
MTVAELDARMTVRELLDWHRFEALTQPLPDRLSDIHFAMLAAIICNLARSAESQPASAADFFVLREPAPPPPDDGLSEVDRQMLAWRGG